MNRLLLLLLAVASLLECIRCSTFITTSSVYIAAKGLPTNSIASMVITTASGQYPAPSTSNLPCVNEDLTASYFISTDVLTIVADVLQSITITTTTPGVTKICTYFETTSYIIDSGIIEVSYSSGPLGFITFPLNGGSTTKRISCV